MAKFACDFNYIYSSEEKTLKVILKPSNLCKLFQAFPQMFDALFLLVLAKNIKRIQGQKDSGSRIPIHIKEFKYFQPKKIVSKLSEI